MSMEAVAWGGPPAPLEQLRWARQILQAEGQALDLLAERLDVRFCRAVSLLLDCHGCVLVTGMGKAGLVGRKISATLASTGSRSHFLHPAEAFHGDLGRIDASDVILVLSQSGETDEVVRLLPALARFRIPIIAVTGNASSTLGRAADVVLDLGPLEEVCPLGLAPSTSTTAMLALGDALALVASRTRGFRPEDFARLHPGGSLGLKLSKVDEHMRPITDCRVAAATATVRDVFTASTRPGRRSGAIMLVSPEGRLQGIFTDSDLARLFEHRRESQLDQPIRDVMTAQPLTVTAGSSMRDAVELMGRRKISELPVLDTDGRPLGLIDITDVAAQLRQQDDSAPDDSPLPSGAAGLKIVPYTKFPLARDGK